MEADSPARGPVTRFGRIFPERKRLRTFVAQGLFSFLQHFKRSARRKWLCPFVEHFHRQSLVSGVIARCGVVGVSEFFCDVRDFEKFATTHFVSSFLSSSTSAPSETVKISDGIRRYYLDSVMTGMLAPSFRCLMYNERSSQLGTWGREGQEAVSRNGIDGTTSLWPISSDGGGEVVSLCTLR